MEPTHLEFLGTFFVTTVLKPIMEFSPITMSPATFEPGAKVTLSQITGVPPLLIPTVHP